MPNSLSPYATWAYSDLDITFQDGLLTIQGERHHTADLHGEKVYRAERRYGAFRRSITLPMHVQADKIEASARDGVLLVLIRRRPGSTAGGTCAFCRRGHSACWPG